MDDKYTVTIYVAAPGTPLKQGGTSEAGHVYFKARIPNAIYYVCRC